MNRGILSRNQRGDRTGTVPCIASRQVGARLFKSLPECPAATSSRCRRWALTVGSASRKNFTSAEGNTFVPISRPSATTAPPLSNLSLDRQQPGPDSGNGRDHRGRGRHCRRSEVAAHVFAIDQHRRELRDGTASGATGWATEQRPPRHPSGFRPDLNDGPGHRPIEGSRVEIQIAQSRGQQLGHGTLADTSRTIDRNDQPVRLAFPPQHIPRRGPVL